MEDKKFIIGAVVLSVLAMIPFYGLFTYGEIVERERIKDTQKEDVKDSEWQRNMIHEKDADFAGTQTANGGKGTKKQKEKKEKKRTKRNKLK